jgi:hypothetical protein
MLTLQLGFTFSDMVSKVTSEQFQKQYVRETKAKSNFVLDLKLYNQLQPTLMIY